MENEQGEEAGPPAGLGLGREGGDDDDFEYGGKKGKAGAIFVLENASLEVGKVGKTMQLLNCDDHANFLRKHRKDPADYRPDICHQALLSVLDSPLNRPVTSRPSTSRQEERAVRNWPAGRPRTFKRFCGLMCSSCRSSASGPRAAQLLRVIKQPVRPSRSPLQEEWVLRSSEDEEAGRFADSVDIKKGRPACAVG